jgi:single-strand DNA-binding protein
MTRDPVIKDVGSQKLTEFGMANNMRWTDREGNRREKTCFVECTAWGKLAEIIEEYGKKGRRIIVQGRLTFDEWEDREGKRRRKHEITVESIEFLDSRHQQEEKSLIDEPTEEEIEI